MDSQKFFITPENTATLCPLFCASSNCPSCQYATACLLACLYCPKEILSQIQHIIAEETQGEATGDRWDLEEYD